MRRHAWIFALLVLGMLPAAAAQTNTPIDVTLLSYQPVPARPGDLLDVYVQLENTGDTATQTVTATILPTEPFNPEGKADVNVGTLAPRATYVARFKVRVARDATAGDRLLTISVRQAGVEEQQRTVPISILPSDAAVFVTDVSVAPASFIAGGDAVVTLTLENLADTRLRDVSVSLDLSESPFSPAEGTTRKKLSTLAPRGQAEISYILTARPTAEADLYRIPVEIDFLDELGNTKEQTDTIGLRVDPLTSTHAYVERVEWNEQTLDVAVRLVNKGLSEVKFVEILLEGGDGPYRIPQQSRHAYIGNIGSDDWETFRFSVETDAQTVELPIRYTYRDAFNREHTGTQTLSISVPDRPRQGNGWVWAGAVAVVAAVVAWRVRRRRRSGR